MSILYTGRQTAGTKKRAFDLGLLCTALSFVIMYFSRLLTTFVEVCILMGVANSIVQTLLPAILSQETDAISQGSIMGLNASYQSIGMIIGPVLGGLVATISIPTTFLVGSMLVLTCFFLSSRILRPGIHKESAF